MYTKKNSRSSFDSVGLKYRISYTIRQENKVLMQSVSDKNQPAELYFSVDHLIFRCFENYLSAVILVIKDGSRNQNQKN